MKKMIILALLVLVKGCYDSDLEFEDQYRIVVESYLYEGNPGSTLTLTSMISFGNDSTGGDPISDALVTLISGDSDWIYIEDDSIAGTYTLIDGPEPVPGDEFQLQIETLDKVLYATTRIPEMPPAVSLSATSMNIPKVEDMMEFHDMEWPDPIELSWDNPSGEYFFITIENIESNPATIMPDPPQADDFPHAGPDVVFRKVTQPTNGEYMQITPRDLTHYGTHRIIFYHVNEEYAKLYQSLDQDTHELNEPYTNVENGLGIFTAFSSDTLYFEVGL